MLFVPAVGIDPRHKLILAYCSCNALIPLFPGLIRPFKELCLCHCADAHAGMVALIRLVELLADRVGMYLIHVLVQGSYILTCLSRLVVQRAQTILNIASAVQD